VPHDVHWEFGVRADAPPFASFVGDRVCRGYVADGGVPLRAHPSDPSLHPATEVGVTDR